MKDQNIGVIKAALIGISVTCIATGTLLLIAGLLSIVLP